MDTREVITLVVFITAAGAVSVFIGWVSDGIFHRAGSLLRLVFQTGRIYGNFENEKRRIREDLEGDDW